MIKRITLASVFCVALFATAAMAHSSKTKTTVKLATYQTSANPADGLFIGSVDAKKKSCADKRKVAVYLQKSGKDKKIGSAKSFSGKGEGYSFLVESKNTKEGTYYAKADSTSKCASDKSNKFKLNFA